MKRESKLIVTLSLLMLTCWTVGSVYAFKPTAEFGHVGICRDAITPISRTASSGETLKFSARAIEEIRDATAGVDEVFSDRGEFDTPEAHCDDELLPACSQRMKSIRDNIINNLKDETTRDGAEARAQLGRALHTLQDFYSHSNWVNSPGPGNTSFNSDLGRRTVTALPATTPTCVDDAWDRTLTGAGLTDITTGYFSLQPGSEPPAGKCSHGKFFGAGIHKDKPGRPFHTEARARAVGATEDFVNQILDAPGIAGNDDAIRAFMDIHGTLGFVIDDTGSMGLEISGVRTSVNQIISSIAGTNDKPDNYLLVRFGDPWVGSAFVTTDPNALFSAVNSISVGGGGDCPELSQRGLLVAIAAAQGGSKLYMYSDASAKDSHLVGNVVAAANAKDVTINYVLTGSCSPIDPAYFRGAQNTGGQVFLLSSSETSKIFGLIEPSLAGNLQPILLVDDNLSGQMRTFDVPVDSTLSRITFSVSLESVSSVRVFRPSGVEATSSDLDVTSTVLSRGRIFTIDAPTPGQWSLAVGGWGRLSMVVMGNSDLSLDSFRFVERRGRIEHEGLFPIKGQPLAGEDQMVTASLVGPFATTEFLRQSPDTTPIDTLALIAGNDEDAADDVFVGTLDPGAGAFRVYARGTDLDGNIFQRAFAPTFRGQSVKVSALTSAARLTPGTVTWVELEVTNLGLSADFRVTAADDLGFVSSVSPSVVTLGMMESATVEIGLFVPAEQEPRIDTLTVVAQSLADASVSNSAIMGLAIDAETDQDGDGFPDDEDACPTSDLATMVVIDDCDSGVENFLFGTEPTIGCTFSDLIAEVATTATNHGDFVSGVADLTNQWKANGLLSGKEKGAVQSCAAQADIP
jgi:hypothetical protein